MQSALQTLLDEKDALQARPDHDHSSIFDRLPVEVLSIIFAFYALKLARKTSPLTLGAVSQRWRSVAWKTSELWTSLSFSALGIRPKSLVPRIQLAKDWLKRSGSLPLSVEIQISSLYGKEHAHHLYGLIDALNERCNQWDSLDLSMPIDALERLDASSCTSLRMRKLILFCDTDGELFIPGLSRTQPLYVKSHSMQLTPNSLDWSFVTYCSMALLKPNRILELLRAAPNIYQCDFDYVQQPNAQSAGEVEHVTNSHLELLNIEFSYEDAEDYFLNNVSLPALKDLEIRASGCVLEVGRLVSFLTRSACNLQTLSVQEFDYPDGDLITLLQSLPSLQELRILTGFAEDAHEEPFYGALISHLPSEDNPAPASSQPLLPALQHFSWYGRGIFPWDVLLYFLAPLAPDSRHRRPLKTIEIQCTRVACDAIPQIKPDVMMEILKASVNYKVKFDLTAETEDGLETDVFALSLDRLEETHDGQ